MANRKGLSIYPLLIVTLATLCACDDSLKPTFSIEVAAIGAQGGSFSNNGNYGVVGSVYHGGSLWRIKDAARLYNWNHHQGEYTGVIAADFSPEGEWALTADEHTLVLWETKDGKAVRFWTAPGDVLSIALSAQGHYALLGLSNNSAVIFDVKRGGVKRMFQHRDRVNSVDLSADGKWAITASDDFTAVVWDVQSGKAAHRFQHQEAVQLALLSADGQRAFSTAKYDKAVVWNARNGDLISTIPVPKEMQKYGVRYTAARFSPDGNYLLTGLPNRLVQLWDVNAMQELGRWRLPKRNPWKPTSASVLALTFSDHTNRFYALASNGFVHQLDLGG